MFDGCLQLHLTILLEGRQYVHAVYSSCHTLPLGNPPMTIAGALSPRALDAVMLNLSSAQCWAGALAVSVYVRSVGVNTTGLSVIPLLLFSILTL